MIRLVGESGQETDVYRRAGDQLYRGSTIEIRPVPSEGGQAFVTLFETRGR